MSRMRLKVKNKSSQSRCCFCFDGIVDDDDLCECGGTHLDCVEIHGSCPACNTHPEMCICYGGESYCENCYEDFLYQEGWWPSETEGFTVALTELIGSLAVGAGFVCFAIGVVVLIKALL
ncbi:MAG: hypothetical protein MN733_20620 [Nitrososphaera sp.]|nr:hypothetical protein [Nitrososphaera sp.]